MSLCFDKICRTCMTESGIMLSVCNEDSQTNEESPIIGLLKSFVSISIHKDDGLPQNICITCLSEINRAICFLLACERSEFTLKMYLQQNISNGTTSNSKIEPSQYKESISRRQHQQEQLQQIIQNRLQSRPQILPDLGDICYFKNEDTAQPSASHENIILFDTETMIHKTDNDLLGDDDDGDKYIIADDKVTEECHKELSHVLYQCPMCCEVFQFTEDLEKHIKCHSKPEEEDGVNIDGCELMNENYDSDEDDKSTNSNTKKVIKSEKPSPAKKLLCDHCKMEFVHKKNLLKHVKKHHTSNIISVSNKGSSNSNKDASVNKQVADEESDDSMSSNHTHLKPVKPPVFQPPRTADSLQCNKCGANFVKEKSLNIHQTLNKCMELAFQCQICQRVFVRKRNLTRHFRTHSDKKEFPCSLCTKEFRRQDQLALHMRDHSTGRKHQCTFCPKAFHMISTLKDHLRIHSGDRPFLCSICGKGFSQSTNLKQHVRRHTQTKPYKCTECPNTFVSKGELDAHLRKHTGDHPFVCDVCGTGFTTSSSLVKHKRIHTGERPYPCDYCPMRFTALGTLKNHRRTHTGERPFACQLCHRTFSQKSDCVSHQRTHTEGRRFSCTQCSRSFQHNSALKSHMKQHVTHTVIEPVEEK